MTNNGIQSNLVHQLHKVQRHNRQGSYKTRERYYQAMLRFCSYLAEHWRLQKLSNISEKHIHAYVGFMKESGKSASTIKTDLSGIRFFHDKMSEAKNNLPDNSELNLSRRKLTGIPRAWSFSEFNKMLAICIKQNREDYALALSLAYYVGLRIHECVRIDTKTASEAVKTSIITVKGKNGKIRSVPINETVKILFEKLLISIERGEKLIVPKDTPTHLYINALQKFISYHRKSISGERDNPLTFHGLRHSYAQNEYRKALAENSNEYSARLKISMLLGHEREDVTLVYLATKNNE